MELQSRDELNVSRDDLKINKINVTGKPTIGKTRFDTLDKKTVWLDFDC